MTEATTEERKPWDQLPGETGKAYGSFIMFLEGGINRSVDKVGEKRGLRSTSGLWKWYSKYDWKGRAAAFDAQATGSVLEELEKAQQAWLAEIREVTAEGLTAARNAARTFDWSTAKASEITSHIKVMAELGMRAHEMPDSLIEINGNLTGEAAISLEAFADMILEEEAGDEYHEPDPDEDDTDE